MLHRTLTLLIHPYTHTPLPTIMTPAFLSGWRSREFMTNSFKSYTTLRHTDGRPEKGAPTTPPADVQLWSKLPLHRQSFVWVTCLLLFLCFIFVSIQYTSDSSIDASTDEHPEFQSDFSFNASMQEDFSEFPPLADPTKLIDFSVGGCNIWKGEWIPHPEGPSYTNATCRHIQPNQNCLKNRRPDRGFLYWRWKPYDCDLPLFDAKALLNSVRGKKWAFIGDSLARNNYQSFICYLSQVEVPKCTFNDGADGNMRWYFKDHKFTLTVIWTPFLIKGTEEEADGFGKGIAKLHLDVVDEVWARVLHEYDYIVLSGGHWYFRTSVYFLQNQPVGCFYCSKLNYTDVGYAFAYRAALRTVLDFLISSKYKGVVFFRTYSPEHWENAPWDQGGNCTQKAPVNSTSVALEGNSLEMYKIQLEEFGRTVQRSSRYSFKLKIVDATSAALLRPDGHPGPYAHEFHPKMQHDCVHWCLPGPIDTWSAMLQAVFKHL